MELLPIGIYGRYASVNGASNCCAIKDGDFTAVIDMGSGAFRELRKAIDVKKIDAVILTHLHYDHIADALVYQYYLEYNDIKSVKLYLPSLPANIAALFTTCRLKKRDIESIGSDIANIESFRVKHARNTDSCMLKIRGSERTLLFTSDFSDASEYARLVKGADIAVADACVSDAEYNEYSPHASIGSIARSTPEETALYLTHLTEGREKESLAEARLYHERSYLLEAGKPIVF